MWRKVLEQKELEILERGGPKVESFAATIEMMDIAEEIIPFTGDNKYAIMGWLEKLVDAGIFTYNEKHRVGQMCINLLYF